MKKKLCVWKLVEALRYMLKKHTHTHTGTVSHLRWGATAHTKKNIGHCA